MRKVKSPPAKIKLNDDQRRELEELAAGGPFAQRAAAVLLMARGFPSGHIASTLLCSTALVSVWRRAYAEGGTERLNKPKGIKHSEHQPLNLTSAERATLEVWAKDASGPIGRDLRARCILLYDRGTKSSQIQKRLDISRSRNFNLRHRFITHRLDGIDQLRRSPKRTADAAAAKYEDQLRRDREEEARRKSAEAEADLRAKQRGDPLAGERDFLARAGLDATPPLPKAIKFNQHGRPDWSRMFKGGGEPMAFALAKRVAAVIGLDGMIVLFQICAGTRFQGHVEWQEPLHIPEDDVVRTVVRAARISKSLRKDTSWGNASRLAEVHGLTVTEVAWEGAKWDGVNRRQEILNATDRPAPRAFKSKRTSTGADAQAS